MNAWLKIILFFIFKTISVLTCIKLYISANLTLDESDISHEGFQFPRQPILDVNLSFVIQTENLWINCL